MANYVKFGRGTKSAAEAAAVSAGMVYFNTTTQEIYLGGKVYGLSTNDLSKLNGAIKGISYDEATRKMTVTYVDGTAADLFTIPVVSDTVPGLMVPAQMTQLNTATDDIAILKGAASVEGSVAKALADAKAYTDESIQILDVAEAGVAGQAIVSLKQEDGKIVAAAGDVAAAHVTVADVAGKFTSADVESVLAEVGADMADTEARLVAIEANLGLGEGEGDDTSVDARIKAAIEALDVAEMAETGKYVKSVSEVDGKVSVTFGQVAASEVSVADESNLFDGTTVEAVLAEIDADHKAGDKAIMDVIGTVTEGKTVAEMIAAAEAAAKGAGSDAIAALDANVSSDANGKAVVTVVQVDGVITSVSLEDKDIASAATLDDVKKTVDAFFAEDAKVEGTIDTLVEIQTWINNQTNDVVTGLVEDIQKNAEAIGNEADRAAAAEDQIEASVGLAADGSYSAPESSNFVKTSTSVMDAIQKLDAAIATQSAAATSVVAEGTDAGNNLSVVETAGENGEKVFTINLTDVASANGVSAKFQEVEADIEANSKLSASYVAANYDEVGTSKDFGECTFAPAAAGDSLENAISKVDSNVAELLGGVLRNELTVAESLTDLDIRINAISGEEGSLAAALAEAKKYADDQDAKVTEAANAYADQAEADAIAEAGKLVEAEAKLARAAEKENKDAIALLNDAATVSGSVAHSVAAGVKEAKDHADSLLEW